MSTWTTVGLAVGLSVAVMAAAVIAAQMVIAGQKRPVASKTVAGKTVAGRHEGPALSRRDLINRGIIGVFAAALSAVVASFGAFIWPTVSGSGGKRYVIGGLDDIKRRLAADRRPYVGGHGTFYLVPFPADRLVEAEKLYPAPVTRGMHVGLVALSPVCTHQGCQVPYCASSAWFECPCHGSRYDGIGEQRRGPAPRGLDHFAVTVNDGIVTVDTTRKFPGPPPGTRTVDEARGAHCY